MKQMKQKVISVVIGIAVLCSSIGYLVLADRTNPPADQASKDVTVTGEITGKRTRYTNHYEMSDGSFQAVSYPEPVNYKKDGKWARINNALSESKGDTSVLKNGNAPYDVKIAKDITRKKLVEITKDGHTIAWGLNHSGIKSRKLKQIKRQKADFETDNTSEIAYNSILDGVDMQYEVHPEFLKENIVLHQKTDITKFNFTLYHTGLTVSEEDGIIRFMDGEGTEVYVFDRLFMTDEKQAYSDDIEVILKTGKNRSELSIVPSKAWLSDPDRAYPVVIDPNVVINTSQSWQVSMGLASQSDREATAAKVSHLYCESTWNIPYIKLDYLPELISKEYVITGGSLVVNNVFNPGQSDFPVSVHKVTQNWNGNTLNYNNKAAYDSGVISEANVNKTGEFSFDVTPLMKDWYAGKANYGVALTGPGNASAVWLTKSPYFTVTYEVPGLSSAQQLTPGEEVQKTGVKAGEETFFYFDPADGIAYDIDTTGLSDTEGWVYNNAYVRLSNGTTGGDGQNFKLYGSYWGRTYIKVVSDGNYGIMVKKRFSLPKLEAAQTADQFTLVWDKVEHAKSYELVMKSEDGSTKTFYPTANDTSYTYSFDPQTKGKVLSFKMRARDSEWCVGEFGRSVYTAKPNSIWSYQESMPYAKNDFATAVMDKKIYVFGGWKSGDNSVKYKGMEVYDTETGTWSVKSSIGDLDMPGLVRPSMAAVNGKIYILGGSNPDNTYHYSNRVYEYDPDKDTYTRKKDMPVGSDQMHVGVSGGKIYVFGGMQREKRVDAYDPVQNIWTQKKNIYDYWSVYQVTEANGVIYALIEDNNKVWVKQYNPSDDAYIPIDTQGYTKKILNKGAVINGKIYMMDRDHTGKVMMFDTTEQKWNAVEDLNITKGYAQMQAVGSTLYSLGGENDIWKALDAVESYSVSGMEIIEKEITAVKGERYQIDITGIHIKDVLHKKITVIMKADELGMIRNSSFMTAAQKVNTQKDIELISYAPNLGIAAFRVNKTVESGKVWKGVINSIPVTAKKTGTATIRIVIEE